MSKRRKPRTYPEARHDMTCPDCGARLVFKDVGRFAPNYECECEECECQHGAHPNGAPLGIPGNKATRRARMAAHKHFDKLCRSRKWTRDESYRWLRQAMNMTSEEAHIARFGIETCERLVAIIEGEFR